MILVTGSTGKVGGALVDQLCAAGVPTRALVRSPERADDLRGYDCETAVGDLTDGASLDEALEGVDAAFLVTPASPQQPDLERAFVDAAARAGTRVVKLAVLGWEHGGIRFAANHKLGVEYLRSSGLPHTVLAPSGFMQNFLLQAAAVQGQGAIYASAGDGAVGWVDVRDIAAVAAHVLTSDGHDGATYIVTGPEALTHAEVAAALTEHVGREVRYVALDDDSQRQGLRAAGVPEWTVEALVELNALYREGNAALVTDEVTKATGRPARSFRDFLHDHPGAFG